MSLEQANAEDNRILPLVQAINALPGLHSVRWCGGHTDDALNDLDAASSTRYQDMHHPPSSEHEYWVEAMADPKDATVLRSLETLALAAQTDEDENDNDPIISITAPWEGITVTIYGHHQDAPPTALAERINTLAFQHQFDPMDPDKETAAIDSRIKDYTQRKLLTMSSDLPR